jgi:Hemin uptake protein hemP
MQNRRSADTGFPAAGGITADPEGEPKMNAHVEPLALMRDTTPCHDATVLTAGGPLARILLNGQTYSLRITRAGKLILTK